MNEATSGCRAAADGNVQDVRQTRRWPHTSYNRALDPTRCLRTPLLAPDANAFAEAWISPVIPTQRIFDRDNV
jgi:hypothetical protein